MKAAFRLKPYRDANRPALEQAVNVAIALTRRDHRGKIFRKVQELFAPKKAKDRPALETDARVKEAVQAAVDELARQGVVPAVKSGKKLHRRRTTRLSHAPGDSREVGRRTAQRRRTRPARRRH